jgi:hypothetical protein
LRCAQTQQIPRQIRSVLDGGSHLLHVLPNFRGIAGGGFHKIHVQPN